MRSKFNAAEVAAIESGRILVRAGRKWHETTVTGPIARDAFGITYAPIEKVGYAQVTRAYPGHVKGVGS